MKLLLCLLFTLNLFSFEPPKNEQEWKEQQTFFRENGYLWIKNFFSPQQVYALQKWADDVHTAAQTMLKLTQDGSTTLKFLQKNIPGTLIVVPEARNPLQACRAEDLLTCYPDLYHFIMGTVTNYIAYLQGEPYVLFKDKLNFKWPGGGAFPPHQDFPAYELFGPREHVTAMISIDPATLQNGCLQVAKKWRSTFPDLQVLPYIEGGPNHGVIQPEYSQKITWIPLETSPGDLILIDSFLPHYSEINKSDHSRRAMLFTHNPLREGDHRKTYYHVKRNDPDNPVFHFATPTKARNK